MLSIATINAYYVLHVQTAVDFPTEGQDRFRQNNCKIFFGLSTYFILAFLTVCASLVKQNNYFYNLGSNSWKNYVLTEESLLNLVLFQIPD